MFPDTMTQVVKHDCRVCHSKVLQTVQPLVSHVQKHQISLENYYKKFILGIDIDEAPPPEPPSGSRRKAMAELVNYKTWVNQCEYECKTCRRKTHTMNAQTVHLKKQHDFVISTPKESADLVNATKVYHQCVLCSKKILLSMGVVQKHMRLVHNMESKDYFTQYILDPFSGWRNACGFSCNQCDSFKTNETEKLAAHMESHGWLMEDFKKHYLALKVHEVRHICLMCDTSILQEGFSLDDHLSTSHGLTSKEYYDNHVASAAVLDSVVTAAAAAASETSSDEEWMNGCLFECKICPVRLESLASMRSHLSSFHATSLEAYESVHGSALVKITQIVCHVCLAAVPCDAEFVTDHLQQIHQMSPDEYQRLYDPPAGKIFSFSLCSCNCSLQPYGRLFLGACECDHRSLTGLVRLI